MAGHGGPITAMSAAAVGVSWTIRPSNITRMRSASASSSSRSSLTSSTAAPALRASRIRAWISATAAKSRPKQGLAAISTETVVGQLARQHGALHVAAGQLADRRVGARVPSP